MQENPSLKPQWEPSYSSPAHLSCALNALGTINFFRSYCLLLCLQCLHGINTTASSASLRNHTSTMPYHTATQTLSWATPFCQMATIHEKHHWTYFKVRCKANYYLNNLKGRFLRHVGFTSMKVCSIVKLGWHKDMAQKENMQIFKNPLFNKEAYRRVDHENTKKLFSNRLIIKGIFYGI